MNSDNLLFLLEHKINFDLVESFFSGLLAYHLFE